MATTNVDIVKISQLSTMEALTSDDHLLVNDHDPSTGAVETKRIFINDLSIDIAGRVTIGDLNGIEVDGASTGNVLKYDGTNWVPATDIAGAGGGGVSLTDLSAVTNPIVLGENASFEYNQYQGIFSFTPPDLRINNMEDVVDQTPTTGQFLRWGGSYWYPSTLDNAFTVENSLIPAGDGSISFENDVLTYTPADLSSYLTEEIDPIFSASAAASITYSDVSNWNSLLLPEADPGLDDLTDVNLGGRTLQTGMVLTYDSSTALWWADYVPYPYMNEIRDVYADNAQSGDILEYDGAQWRAIPNPSSNIEAGRGLVGGGVGDVSLHVNPGQGIAIQDDAVVLNAALEDLYNVGGVSGSSNTGQVLTWNGHFWIGMSNAESTVTAGPGLGGGGEGDVSLSVNTGTGIAISNDNVVLDAVLSNLNDVSNTTGAAGDVLTWDGSTWSPHSIEAEMPISVNPGEGLKNIVTGNINTLYVNPGFGIDVSNNQVNLDATLENLSNVHSTHPRNPGEVLTWNGTQWLAANVGIPLQIDVNPGEGLKNIVTGNINTLYVNPGLGIEVSNNQVRLDANIRDINDVSNDTPINGQVLTWDGSEWGPATIAEGEGVNAGTGIDVSGSVVSLDANIQNLNNVNASNPTDGQVLTWNGSSNWIARTPEATTAGTGIIVTGSQVSLNAKLHNLNNVSASNPTSGQVLTWNGSNNWIARTPEATTAGTGITVSGSQVSLDANIQNLNNVSSNNPSSGQVLTWNGSEWGPATIADGEGVNAGTGIDVTGSVVSLDANIQNLNNVNVSNPSDGQVLTWNGSNNWIARTPEATTAGTGITVSGSQVSLNAKLHNLNNVSASNPTSGQVLTWNGSNNWIARTPEVSTAGTGIDVTGSVVSLDANIQNLNNVSASDPKSGQVLTWNGSSNWVARTPEATTAGTGIDVAGGQVSLDANLRNIKDCSVTSPTVGEVLTWNGTKWSGESPEVITAGSGIDVAGGQVSLDANLQNLNNVNSGSATPGQVLTWNGSNWVGQTPAEVNVQVGWTVKMWGFIQKVSGNLSISPEGNAETWQVMDGSGNFTVEEEDGWGRCRIVFDTPMANQYYSIALTVYDDEGDHMCGIIRQRKDYVIVYSKDLEEWTAAGGLTNSNDSGEGFSFQIVY